ncbi:MAG: hypothetical protein N2171_02535 [Clostridia bacterium]|nr:hypothetical protein [Clostridia bacterium]
MKTIYIHGGTPKTATTSLQNFLLSNNEALRKYDIYYPCYNKKYFRRCQHYPLIKHMIGAEGRFVENNEEICRLFDEFFFDIKHAQQNNVIISTEMFWEIETKEALINLKERLSGFDVKIIVYLRKQDDGVISWQNELVKSGKNFCKNINSIKKKDSPAYIFYDYYSRIKLLGEIFGDNNVIVRIFEKSLLYKNNIINDFMKIFNVELEDIGNSQFNESMFLEKYEFLYKLCDYFEIDDLTDGRFSIGKNLRNYVSYTLKADYFGNTPIKSAVKDEIRIKVLEVFKESNDRLFSEILGMKNIFNNYDAAQIEEVSKISDEEPIIGINMDDALFSQMLVKLLSRLFDYDEYKRKRKEFFESFLNDEEIIMYGAGAYLNDFFDVVDMDINLERKVRVFDTFKSGTFTLLHGTKVEIEKPSREKLGSKKVLIVSKTHIDEIEEMLRGLGSVPVRLNFEYNCL